MATETLQVTDGNAAEIASRIKALSPEDAKQLYDATCTNIRETDETSFKLLGFVPLVSGSGITVLLSTNTTFSRLPIVIFVGLFGAVITFGLHRWELRNVGTCNWLIKLGADLEQHRFGLARGQFLDRPPAPELFGLRMGKTEAERVIYWTAIVAWLLLPVVSLIAADIEH